MNPKFYKISKKCVQKLIDFLFPKSKTAKILENLSSNELFKLYPKAKINKDTHIKSIFEYNDPFIKDMIWELKFFRNTKVAELCAELVYLQIDNSQYILIPVPIHKAKKRHRGFNQTELICEYLVKKDKANKLDYRKKLVVKIKNTKNQHDIKNKKVRLNNLKNVFKVTDIKFIKNKNFLIIDDVTTTGATIFEITKVLKEAGANEVKAITIAH